MSMDVTSWMIWLFSRVKAGFHLRQSRNRNRKSAYDLVKLKNRSRKRSHKLDGIGVGKIRTFPFSCYSAYYPVASFRLWSSENQIVGVGSRSGRISQSKCSLKRFVIGLVLPLLLATPTTQFSLDRKRRSRKLNNNAVSLSRIVPHSSVYDSVAGENQP